MYLFEENSPSRCDAVGLDCETCVSHSAREIAACCASLKGDGLTKIFKGMYPSSGCAPMSGFFNGAYVAAISIAPAPVAILVADPAPAEPRRKEPARAPSYAADYEAGISRWLDAPLACA